MSMKNKVLAAAGTLTMVGGLSAAGASCGKSAAASWRRPSAEGRRQLSAGMTGHQAG